MYLRLERVDAALDARITYHDSCSGLRELEIKASHANCSTSMDGVTLTEMKNPDVCCGFGGTFAVKYSDISNSIVSRKRLPTWKMPKLTFCSPVILDAC